jgi:hypothetical protein
MQTLVLSVDYGQTWPLSDIFWNEEQKPDWGSLLTPQLITRLHDWAAYFTAHANEETGSFGGEDNRKWFDLEGVRLLNDLTEQAGQRHTFKLDLWF